MDKIVRAICRAQPLIPRATVRLQSGNAYKKSFTFATAAKAAQTTDTAISGARANARKQLETDWGSRYTTHHPFFYLRQNCLCSHCLSPSSHQRIYPFSELNLQLEPKSVETTDDGVRIVWPDDHQSLYPAQWLLAHTFDGEQLTKNRQRCSVAHPQLWSSAEMDNKITTETFSSLMSDDRDLYRWLKSLFVHGIAMATNVPTRTGQLHRLGERIGFLRKTHLGETFHVIAEKSPVNLDRSSCRLDLHTDTPYYEYVPGIQVLHCISNASVGGESLFADGFAVAAQYKKLYPDRFKLLTETPVYFTHSGFDDIKFYKVFSAPIIGLNEEGEVEKISYNYHCQDSVMDLPLDQVEYFYESVKLWYDMLHHPDNMLTIKLRPGEMMAFHNYRVLHGRSEFRIGGGRQLEGAYYDWDEALSVLRVINDELRLNDIF